VERSARLAQLEDPIISPSAIATAGKKMTEAAVEIQKDYLLDENPRLAIGQTIYANDRKYNIVKILRNRIYHRAASGEDAEGYDPDLANANEWTRYFLLVKELKH
jgi:hypothetical protein